MTESRYWLAQIKPYNIKTLFDLLPKETTLFIDKNYSYETMDNIIIALVFRYKHTIQYINTLPIIETRLFPYHDQKLLYNQFIPYHKSKK